MWASAIVLRLGALAYLPPVRAYANQDVADASLRLTDFANALFVPVMASFGVLILLRSASRRYGWLMLFTGFWFGLIEFATNYSQYALLVAPGAGLPLGLLAAWAHDLWMLNFILIGCLPFLFPDGNLPSPRWRWVFWPIIASWGFLAVTYAVAERPLGYGTFQALGEIVPNPLGIIPYRETMTNVIFGLLVPAQTLGGLASLIARWRGAAGEVRQQIKWVLYFLILLLVMFMVTYINGLLLNTVGIDPGPEKQLVFVGNLLLAGAGAALGIAIFRYRLYDIDLIINRTLVYGGLTAVVLGTYILFVAGLGALLPIRNNRFLVLLATGVIAVLFNPLRVRLQRAANHLVFGQRDDPYVVLSQLGRRLSGSAAPAAILHTVVETIATALKLPYAAIQLEQGGAYKIRAEYGTAGPDQIPLPLVHQNEVVGQLVVAPRSPGEPLTSKDRRLLEDIAHQTGAVAHAVRLTADLQRSRQRLVTAREEERRRLRRDLHDELGPMLASHTLKLDTAMDLMPDAPQAAIEQLQDLKRQTQEIVADIRRLVHELRPPALDDLGLVGAVQAHIRHIRRGTNGLRIAVEAPPDGLPPLSAAVELAAYRIAMEAVTNAIRHAGAQRCRVSFALTDGPGAALQICIGDDGVGLPRRVRPGVGMTSMRERAEELGGRVVIEAGEGGGTRVQAELPLTEGSEA